MIDLPRYLWEKLKAWREFRRAAWVADGARTWPLPGDVWTGFGERIEVQRVAVRAGGVNGLDLLLVKGAETRSIWAPYADFARDTRGMTLVRRAEVAP